MKKTNILLEFIKKNGICISHMQEAMRIAFSGKKEKPALNEVLRQWMRKNKMTVPEFCYITRFSDSIVYLWLKEPGELYYRRLSPEVYSRIVSKVRAAGFTIDD